MHTAFLDATAIEEVLHILRLHPFWQARKGADPTATLGRVGAGGEGLGIVAGVWVVGKVLAPEQIHTSLTHQRPPKKRLCDFWYRSVSDRTGTWVQILL